MSINSKSDFSDKKDISESYNKFKEFEGKPYTGVKVGRGHSWIYDSGQWKETKVTPDKWEIHYAVTKRRKGRAPEGSGVPVGTKYHWYILAHQIVQKLNANDYTTEMTGIKYKVAHQRANKEEWNISDLAQKRRMLKILQELASNLEAELAATAKTKIKSKSVKEKVVATKKRISKRKSTEITKTKTAVKSFPKRMIAKNEPYHTEGIRKKKSS